MHDAMPRDPDWDDVPPALAALDGQRVKLTAWDRDEDDVLRGDSDVLVIVPGWFGHARRVREGDGDA